MQLKVYYEEGCKFRLLVKKIKNKKIAILNCISYIRDAHTDSETELDGYL